MGKDCRCRSNVVDALSLLRGFDSFLYFYAVGERSESRCKVGAVF
jgi:hypothetical protein